MMDIEAEFDKFFEFPTDDKSQVSSTSCKLFAVHIAELERNKFGEPMIEVARVQVDGNVEWKPNLPDLPVGTPLYTKKG